MWGYKYCSKRGKEIATFIDLFRPAPLNDPETPTLRGTARDTTAGLSLLVRFLDVAWINTQVILGSDHDIFQLTTRGGTFKTPIGSARDRFREEKCT